MAFLDIIIINALLGLLVMNLPTKQEVPGVNPGMCIYFRSVYKYLFLSYGCFLCFLCVLYILHLYVVENGYFNYIYIDDIINRHSNFNYVYRL